MSLWHVHTTSPVKLMTNAQHDHESVTMALLDPPTVNTLCYSTSAYLMVWTKQKAKKSTDSMASHKPLGGKAVAPAKSLSVMPCQRSKCGISGTKDSTKSNSVLTLWGWVSTASCTGMYLSLTSNMPDELMISKPDIVRFMPKWC